MVQRLHLHLRGGGISCNGECYTVTNRQDFQTKSYYTIAQTIKNNLNLLCLLIEKVNFYMTLPIASTKNQFRCTMLHVVDLNRQKTF